MTCPQITLLGIRHHGPGSARAVAEVLSALKPDCVLLEGPEDAQDAVHLALKPDLVPPVALLVHATDDPKRAVFYPFASFSPEWQAIQYAVHEHVHLQWMDLSASQQMSLEDLQADAEQAQPQAASQQDFLAHEDPLDTLAIAAGYSDGEAFWDEVLETQRAVHGKANTLQAELATFEAITQAMLAIRSPLAQCDTAAPETIRALSHHASTPQAAQREALREAQMRQTLRQALTAQYQRIVVVCGAWHTPALLDVNAPGYAKSDTALLKTAFAQTRRVKTSAAWAPWSFDRLALRSGYGAGVSSPQWYQMLWDTHRAAPAHPFNHSPGSYPGIDSSPTSSILFATAAARLLRDADLDASSASAIESVRLAEQLSALRGRSQPSLDDLLQAIQSVLAHGHASPMQLIHKQLVIGSRLGSLPADAPLTPLHADLLAEAKRLRLPLSGDEKIYELDLRKPNDLARSHLLHRLLLLHINWGDKQTVQGRVQGTFHEHWRVQWQPEFAVECVMAARLGATVAQAAHASAMTRASSTDKVTELVDILDELMLADLPHALSECVTRLSHAAAASKDTLQMMQAFGRLANIRRYGSVRQTDGAVLGSVLGTMAARISIGVVGACFSLDDDAANAMNSAIASCDAAYQLLDEPTWRADWLAALTLLADQNDAVAAAGIAPAQVMHGLVTGLCARLTYNHATVQAGVDEDAQAFVLATTQHRMSRALSQGHAVNMTAAWIEGFNSGNASALLHDDALWRLLHQWLGDLQEDYFITVLPLLRRSFSLFAQGERYALFDKAKAYVHLGAGSLSSASEDATQSVPCWNEAAAQAMLPLLSLMFEDKP